MNDITTQQDLEKLVRTFYNKVLNDDLLKPHFAGMNVEAHFPVMISFWSNIVFADGAYKGNAFEKHLRLKLSAVDFAQWLSLFNETMNELFNGEKATLAIQRAQSIAWIFESKLKQNGLLLP